MPAQRTPAAIGWGIVLALLSLAAYWTASTSVDMLRAEVRLQVRSLPKPPTVNGLRISMKGVAHLWPDGDEPLRVPAERILLIVTSDICEGCKAAVSGWRELLDTLSVRATDEVVVASFRGTSILSDLVARAKQRGVRVRALQVTQQAVFAVATGLTITPTTAVLDDDARIRFISNDLTSATRQSLRSAWASANADASPLVSTRLTTILTARRHPRIKGEAQ